MQDPLVSITKTQESVKSQSIIVPKLNPSKYALLYRKIKNYLKKLLRKLRKYRTPEVYFIIVGIFMLFFIYGVLTSDENMWWRAVMLCFVFQGCWEILKEI